MTKRRSKTIVILTLMAVLLTAIFGYCLNFDNFNVNASEIIRSNTLENVKRNTPFHFSNEIFDMTYIYTQADEPQKYSLLCFDSPYMILLNENKTYYLKDNINFFDKSTFTFSFNTCVNVASSKNSNFFLNGYYIKDYYLINFIGGFDLRFGLGQQVLSSDSMFFLVFNSSTILFSIEVSVYDSEFFLVNFQLPLGYEVDYVGKSFVSNTPSYSSISAPMAFSTNYAVVKGISDILWWDADDNYNTIFNQGYAQGLRANEYEIKNSYEKGFNAGQKSNQSLTSIIPSTLGAVAVFFKDILSFDIFGISMFSIIGTMGAILLALWLVKMVKGG